MYLRQNEQNCNINIAQHCDEDIEKGSPEPTECIHEEIRSRLSSGNASC